MKLFVWDFHGVLEKGNDEIVLEITNEALKQHDYSRRMTEQENHFLSGHRWHEYFSFLMPELEEEQCLKLQCTCIEISQGRWEVIAKHIRLNDHADTVLESIHNSEHHQILISNTQPEGLDIFVKMVNIGRYFPLSHRFGVNTRDQIKLTKQESLNRYLKDNDLFDTVVSIGDSPGDMALIHERIDPKGIGYLYTHPGKEHRPTNCHYKINDLRMVLQEISGEMACNSTLD